MSERDTTGQTPATDTGEAHTPVPELSGGTHFPCLDAYRGIGMTMVLLNHAAFATGWYSKDNALAQLSGPFIARMDLSVPMFFVMSGFLLYRPFAKAALAERDAIALPRFYRRRALRILPAYWFALVGLALLIGLPIASTRSWIGNVLLLPAFGAPVQACNATGECHVGYGITQAWSIGVEASYYLLLPLYALVMARLVRSRGQRAKLSITLAGLAVLYLSSTAFRAYVVQVDPPWSEQSLLWLPMFLDLFAIGMALAVLSAWAAQGQVIPRAFSWLGEHPNLAWSIAGLIFFAVTRMKYPDRPFGLHSADGSSDYLPRQFLYGIASAVWLAPAIFGDQTVGLLRKVLASRFLVYLGAISLSFYLWHLAIIDKVKAWTIPGYDQLQGLQVFSGNYLLIVALSWSLSFVVASILFRLVELPFLRLKDEPLRALFRTRREGGARD